MQRGLSRAVRGMCTSVGFAALLGQPAAAQVWTDWTAMTQGSPGAAVGAITFPGPTTIGVTYVGQVLGGSQTTCGTAWLNSTFPAYDGSGLGGTSYNSPLPCDMIQVNSPGSFRFTFSAPVRDPFMAFVSVGRGGNPVRYDFSNAPFSIIDEGAGPFGDGSLAALPGDVLEGQEGHGVIRFQGTYTTLEGTIAPGEHWHGFTVGAAGLGTSTVPEPMSMALLATGLGGLALVRWRRRKDDDRA